VEQLITRDYQYLPLVRTIEIVVGPGRVVVILAVNLVAGLCHDASFTGKSVFIAKAE
jgi:hypothetical protein